MKKSLHIFERTRRLLTFSKYLLGTVLWVSFKCIFNQPGKKSIQYFGTHCKCFHFGLFQQGFQEHKLVQFMNKLPSLVWDHEPTQTAFCPVHAYICDIHTVLLFWETVSFVKNLLGIKNRLVGHFSNLFLRISDQIQYSDPPSDIIIVPFILCKLIPRK